MSTLKMYRNGTMRYTLEAGDDAPESIGDMVCAIANDIDFNAHVFGVDEAWYDNLYHMIVDNWVSGDVREYVIGEDDLETLQTTRHIRLESRAWMPPETIYPNSRSWLQPWELDYKAKHMIALPRQYGARGNRAGYRVLNGHPQLWSYDSLIFEGTYTSPDTLVLSVEWFGYSPTTLGHINAFIRMMQDKVAHVFFKHADGYLEPVDTMNKQGWVHLCACATDWN